MGNTSTFVAIVCLGRAHVRACNLKTSDNCIKKNNTSNRITESLQIVTNGFEVKTARADFITLLHIAIPVATNRLLSSKISRGGRAIVALPIARGARLAYC